MYIRLDNSKFLYSDDCCRICLQSARNKKPLYIHNALGRSQMLNLVAIQLFFKKAARRSPIMIVVALVLARTVFGMIEASAIRRPSTP